MARPRINPVGVVTRSVDPHRAKCAVILLPRRVRLRDSHSLARARIFRGFTLIELLVVLVLMVLFSGAAAPRVIQAIKEFTFRTDLANIEKVLRYGQYHAVLEDRVYKLTMDQADGAYTLYRQAEREDFRNYETVTIGRRTTHTLNERAHFMSGRGEFYFFPDGTVTLPFRILLESDRGARVEITSRGLGLFRTVWQRE